MTALGLWFLVTVDLFPQNTTLSPIFFNAVADFFTWQPSIAILVKTNVNGVYHFIVNDLDKKLFV